MNNDIGMPNVGIAIASIKRMKTSVGERKMRNALIEVLLKLNEDKQYDIATALCRQLGYKMVELEKPVYYIGDKVINNKTLQPIDESGESAGFAIFSNGADQNGD